MSTKVNRNPLRRYLLAIARAEAIDPYLDAAARRRADDRADQAWADAVDSEAIRRATTRAAGCATR